MENPSNSYIIDFGGGAELARLIILYYILEEAMGGLFPDEKPSYVDVLDIACGPGMWALEVARAHPEMNVLGVDINKPMIDYAKAHAAVRGLENIHFQVMDVTQPLQFPDASFDFVNARFIESFMLKEMWPAVIQEFVRITRPGGTVRLTACDDPGTTNSLAFERYKTLFIQAAHQEGRLLHPLGLHGGVTPLLSQFLRKAGCQHLREQPHVLNFSSHTRFHHRMTENFRMFFVLGQPWLLKTGIVQQAELDVLYEQMVQEMMQPDFHGLLYFLSAWGQKM